MYNIGICDDGYDTCSSVENMILRYAEKNGMKEEVLVWYTGEELCKYLKQGSHLDILFLDIELVELNGIQAGDFIRNQLEDREMQIIYISGKSSYAQQLFKTQPMDFLVKPVTQMQIDGALETAVKILKKSTGKFQYQTGKEYFYVPYGKIMYFASRGRKIIIHTEHEEKEFYGRMTELAENLPDEFLLIHQSFMVNKMHVVRYTYETVELTDGTELVISKAHRKQVREHILREG